MYYFTLLGSLLASGCCFAQTTHPSVVAAAGAVGQNGSVRMEYTIGEPLTRAYNGPATMLTQGFHQPIVTAIGVSEWEQAAIQLYPNPAQTELLVSLPEEVYTRYSLHDAAGKHVADGDLSEAHLSIPLNGFATGVYRLSLLGKQTTVLTFIKH